MKSFSIFTGNTINRRMISEAIQLDRISYDGMYQLQLDTCVDYFDKNKDIYIMAVNDESGHVIGYINFSPIRKSVFKKLMSGSVLDTVITGKDILSYQDGNLYWGYFSSIVVHPEYRKQGISTQLLFSWSNLIYQLAVKHDIYFRKIVADAITEAGVHLLSELGFSFVKSSIHKSKIMTLNLFTKNTIQSKLNDKVLAVYKERNGKSDVVSI